MPLLKFDLIEGRSPREVAELLDAAHRAVTESFSVPEADRYQLVTEHKRYQVSVLDTGLGITRTESLVVLTVITSPRTREAKETFYRTLVRELMQHCDIESSDVIVSIVENTKEDWSFGNGNAQYLTGEL
nr:tautomerase family protein [Rhizobium sp. Q54]